ncbi:hypothetical protein [Candidatus Uabimicrobium amorphum]|uniref:Type IV-A pilus assembly ATPase PilB n=1 Tax=Uabimicrobium amorphum TaxID=2596890 RepID=A0A5S9IJG2_UABAM|nr:hypothetical protein [Candidatus Uabimicrobium amorphum]BBM82978.1 type IV-A pilus assembly ATPase PilB [Candidatus Uabimicrobium amorphum]
MDRTKLGNSLVNAKKITKEALKTALSMHDKIGGDFAPLLVKLGYISDKELTTTLAKLEGVHSIDISSLVIPAILVREIPRSVIEQHNVMPISKKDGQITLAIADVNNFEAIESIQFLTNCRVEPVLASKEAIRKAIIQFYNSEENRDFTSSEGVASYLNSTDDKFRTLQKAVIELLLEKKIITESELTKKIDRIK